MAHVNCLCGRTIKARLVEDANMVGQPNYDLRRDSDAWHDSTKCARQHSHAQETRHKKQQ